MSTTSGQAVAAGRMRAPRPSAVERLGHAASKLTLPVILLLPAMTIIVGPPLTAKSQTECGVGSPPWGVGSAPRARVTRCRHAVAVCMG